MFPTQSRPPAVDLDELVGLFYEPADPPASFRAMDNPELMPEPFKQLLKHEAHMLAPV